MARNRFLLAIGAFMLATVAGLLFAPTQMVGAPVDPLEGCSYRQCDGANCVGSLSTLDCYYVLDDDWQSMTCQTEPCAFARSGP